jgi:hypothetical protein
MDKTVAVRALLILAAGVVLFWLVSNYNAKQSAKQAEKFYQDNLFANLSSSGVKEMPYLGSDLVKRDVAQVSSVSPAEAEQESEFRAIDYETKKVASDCFPKDRLSATDLLPKDAANSKWAQVAPAGQGDLQDQNFLTAGFNLGLDTVGSSLRNANQQIRSEPPIAKTSNWPIHMSTIDADLMRKPLDMDWS